MALFTGIFKWLIIVFIGLYFLIWSLSSPVAKHFLTPLLAEQGLRLSENSSIRFNPFLTRLSIKNLQLLDNKTNIKTLEIKQLTLQLALHQLAFKQIKVQQFVVDDFYVQVEKSAKNIKIAGFVIDNKEKTPEAEANNSPSKENQYQLHVPKLALSNGDIDINLDGQKQQLKIDDLMVTDTIASTTNIISTVALSAQINQAKTLLNAKLTQQDKLTNIVSNFSISGFSLNNIPQHLLKQYPQITQLAGLVSLSSEQVITLDDKALNIALAKTNVTPENIELGLKNNKKSWQVNIVDIHTQLSNLAINIPQKVKKQATTKAAQALKTVFSFDEFSLTMNKPLTFIDRSFNNELVRTVQIQSLTLGKLSNSEPDSATPLALQLKSNDYATLTVKGSLMPFAKTPKYTLDANLKELSLPSLTPYIEQVAGFSLQSGQLDNQLTLSLTGDKIVGNTKFLIKGLETANTNSDDVNLLQSNSAMPLNMALGVLKDSRGNVELEVPLSGSTNDPKFGLGSIFALITQKAVFSATKSYAINTFLPYANIMSVALTAGDFLLKTRFADFPYQDQQIIPNKQQQAYLTNFITLMTENKTLTVKVCGFSVRQDIENNGKNLSKKILANNLKNIAKKRVQAFKNYVLTQSNIASDRLLLCAPQYDLSDKAKPRIELSI